MPAPAKVASMLDRPRGLSIENLCQLRLASNDGRGGFRPFLERSDGCSDWRDYGRESAEGRSAAPTICRAIAMGKMLVARSMAPSRPSALSDVAAGE